MYRNSKISIFSIMMMLLIIRMSNCGVCKDPWEDDMNGTNTCVQTCKGTPTITCTYPEMCNSTETGCNACG